MMSLKAKFLFLSVIACVDTVLAEDLSRAIVLKAPKAQQEQFLKSPPVSARVVRDEDGVWKLLVKNLSSKPIAISKTITSWCIAYYDAKGGLLAEGGTGSPLESEDVDHVILNPAKEFSIMLGHLDREDAESARCRLGIGLLSSGFDDYLNLGSSFDFKTGVMK